MLALHRQTRRIEARGLSPRFFVVLFFSTLSLLTQAAPGNSGPARSSSFSARLMNLEATAKETFRFTASLFNGQNRSAIYELQARTPAGWNSVFRVDGMQVTSFKLDSNKSQDVSIELTPSPSVKPGKYAIPVVALSDGSSLELNLEAVVKGSYTIELTTPNGLLSEEVTEGSRKPIYLSLKNEGSLPLDNLELAAQTPTNWNVSFEPAKIERLDPGSSINVVANLNVPDKTIAGDYLTKFTVKNNNATAESTHRLTVTTSWLAGWLGITVILLAVGMVYVLIRKYGRR
ncbi:NEW3 domain-containing protein [Niastella sp. OAS944]|uniref:COG1470 family protein n=1 Tax=Niastella sp. OAS944 TaxID=2664089 RepID=UPI0034754EFC|nr:putative membrane protein [Chitinophagaceae bacterium OAS944]